MYIRGTIYIVITTRLYKIHTQPPTARYDGCGNIPTGYEPKLNLQKQQSTKKATIAYGTCHLLNLTPLNWHQWIYTMGCEYTALKTTDQIQDHEYQQKYILNWSVITFLSEMIA